MSATTSATRPIITVDYDDCTLELCPIAAAQLPYDPNLAGNVLFLSIHSAALVANLGLGCWYRTWGYLTGMAVGCILEVLGYVGRLQMHYNPFPEGPLLLYLICVTTASVFFTAAIYLSLGRIVVVYGEQLSLLRPRTYTIWFIACDVVSLLLQAVGGTIVSIADDQATNDIGVHVMQAGLCFQVLSLVVFTLLCGIFAWSCARRRDELNPEFIRLRASKRFRFFLWTLSIATIAMLVRCSFRIAELSEGFKGPIWYNEIDYMVLEGAVISICVILLTVGHPGFGFGRDYHGANFNLRIKKTQN